MGKCRRATRGAWSLMRRLGGPTSTPKARGFTASSTDMYFEGVSPDADIDERIVQPAANLSDVPLKD